MSGSPARGFRRAGSNPRSTDSDAASSAPSSGTDLSELDVDSIPLSPTGTPPYCESGHGGSTPTPATPHRFMADAPFVEQEAETPEMVRLCLSLPSSGSNVGSEGVPVAPAV